MEAVGAGDVAFGGAWGADNLVGGVESGDFVEDDELVGFDFYFAAELEDGGRFFEDEKAFEYANEVATHEEASGTEDGVLEGRAGVFAVRDERALDEDAVG